MKKRDFMLIGVLCGLALILFLAGRLYYRDQGGLLQITVENQIYGTYSLEDNQEISIGSTNTCQIQDGKVTMSWADCPDQLCVHSLAIESGGGSIICMPNRVVLQIVSEQDTDTTNGMDGIAG